MGQWSGPDARDAALSAALEFLDMNSEPRLFARRNGAFLWNNKAAGLLFRQARWLVRMGDEIFVPKSAHREALKDLVNFASCDRASYRVLRDDNDGCLLVGALALDGGEGAEEVVLLTLTDIENPPAEQLVALNEAFGLTPKETWILQRLCDGLNVDEIAPQAKISLETVRSHIRNIYRKLGVSGREALFHRARPFLTIAPRGLLQESRVKSKAPSADARKELCKIRLWPCSRC